MAIEIDAKNCFTELPLTIEIIGENGSKEIKVLQIKPGKNTFSIDFKENINDVRMDPNVELLFESNAE